MKICESALTFDSLSNSHFGGLQPNQRIPHVRSQTFTARDMANGSAPYFVTAERDGVSPSSPANPESPFNAEFNGNVGNGDSNTHGAPTYGNHGMNAHIAPNPYMQPAASYGINPMAHHALYNHMQAGDIHDRRSSGSVGALVEAPGGAKADLKKATRACDNCRRKKVRSLFMAGLSPNV